MTMEPGDRSHKLHRRCAIALLPTTLLVGLAALSSASAANVSCGQTITVSATLTGDVGPCSGDGIIIGADRITLNLNGHRIYGDAAVSDGNAAGIRLPERTKVTIVGRAGRRGPQGAVSGFDAGVVINGGSNNKVTTLIVEDNVSHVETDPPGSSNYTAFLGDGIVVFNSARNLVANNVIRRNGYYDNVAILGVGSDGNVIRNNEITEGAEAPEVVNPFGLGTGVILNSNLLSPAPSPTPSIYDNIVVGNGISNNPGPGISNVSNVNGVVQANEIIGNGFYNDQESNAAIGLSYYLSGEPNTNVLVARNLIADNAGAAIFSAFSSVADGTSIVANSVSGNGSGIDIQNLAVVRDNKVTGNDGPGIGIGGSDNVVDGNTVTGNLTGIFHAQSVGGSVVSANIVQRNRGSGIHVYSGLGDGIRPIQFLNNVVTENNQDGELVFDILCPTLCPPAKDISETNVDNVFQWVDAVIAANEWLPLDGFFTCGKDIWSGNVWSEAGYFPECVTAGGSGPPDVLPEPPSEPFPCPCPVAVSSAGETIGTAAELQVMEEPRAVDDPVWARPQPGGTG